MNKKTMSVMLGVVIALATWPIDATFHVHRALAEDNVIVVQGNITVDTTWRPENLYDLIGGVFVKAPATLTILPGTSIFGEAGSFLVIDRGAKIMASGDATAPIVFTSSQPEGQRARQDWGGLILNGFAPINEPGGEAIGEGDTGVYGGNDPHDSSGVLRYVRVEFGGFAISPDNELNCIAFQGVGDGTVVDHVEALRGGDDAFEWFGGTVNVKHLLAVAALDDSFDWTDGWAGKAQFLVAQQSGDAADHGIEADNNAENHNFLPRSAPTIYNATLIGDPNLEHGPGSTVGILLRVGTAGTFRNFIVTGFKHGGVEIRNAATFQQVDNGSLSFASAIFFDNSINFTSNQTAQAMADFPLVSQTDPQLQDPFNQQAPDFRPVVGSPARDPGRVTPPPDDGFFEPTTIIGGVDPTNDWTRQGWTNFAAN